MPLTKNKLTRKKHAPTIDAKPAIDRIMKPKILGLIRHALTFGGGYLVSQGWLDADQVLAISGGIATIIGALWSVKAPEKKAA